MRISGLSLNNVGVFDKLSLQFESKPNREKAEIHIFTGENGTGKTTLLESLTSFDFYFNHRGEEKIRRDPLRYKARVAKNVRYNGKIYFEKMLLEFTTGKGARASDDFFESYYSDIDYSKKRLHNYHYFAYGSHFQLSDSKVDAFRRFDFDPINDALELNKIEGRTSLFQWIANNKTRSALSFQKGDKLRADRYLWTISKVETAIAQIIDRQIEFVVDEHSLNVLVKLNGEYCQFDTLADGYRSVINWLTDLLFRLDSLSRDHTHKFTLFLDEIDIHLHPAAQRRILPVIRELFPHAQIFLTTHSPFVVGSIDGAWVYKFKLDDEGRSRLDGEPFLTEDAASYRQILERVFDISENFGIEVENSLDRFYVLRDLLMKDSSKENLRLFIEKARELTDQSPEVRAIIGNEIRQLSRLLNMEISL